MATFVSYSILSDGPVKMSDDGLFGVKVKDFNWDPHDDINLNTFHDSPILNLRIDPDNNASNITIKVTINDGDGAFRQIFKWTVSGGVSRHVSEVMDRTNVNKRHNKIRFEVLEGSGTLQISDVYILYKRR